MYSYKIRESVHGFGVELGGDLNKSEGVIIFLNFHVIPNYYLLSWKL